MSVVTQVVELAATVICWVGHGAVRAGSMMLARQLFGLAHAVSPRHSWAVQSLAWCLRETRDRGGAVMYYQQLLELHPSFVDARVELGFAVSGLQRYPEALEQFQIAVDQSPRHKGARIGLAAMLMSTNHYAEAIPVCEKLARENPADSAAWGFLARARAEGGQWEDALAAYEAAQQL